MTKKTIRSSRGRMASRTNRRAKRVRSGAILGAYARKGIKIPRASGFSKPVEV